MAPSGCTSFSAKGRRLNRPAGHQTALDFGCGVGRTTRALAPHFEKVTGLDISATMIERARDLNRDVANVEFTCNARPDLAIFPAATFDLVACDIVLQHLPGRREVQGYLAEFVRVLRPDGLLVFQLPISLPLAVRIQPRRTAYRLMRIKLTSMSSSLTVVWGVCDAIRSWARMRAASSASENGLTM